MPNYASVILEHIFGGILRYFGTFWGNFGYFGVIWGNSGFGAFWGMAMEVGLTWAVPTYAQASTHYTDKSSAKILIDVVCCMPVRVSCQRWCQGDVPARYNFYLFLQYTYELLLSFLENRTKQ